MGHAASNRTIVELKCLRGLQSIRCVRFFQSNHSGIEIAVFHGIEAQGAFFQSNHSGIEMTVGMLKHLFEPRFQSNHSGIEIIAKRKMIAKILTLPIEP